MLSGIINNYLPVDRINLRGDDFYNKKTNAIKKELLLVDNNHGWQDRKTCPVCLSNDYKIEFASFGIDIVACQKCTLRYTAKVPIDPNDVYDDLVYFDNTQNSCVDFHEYRKKRFGKDRIQLIINQLGNIKGKKLLDIGSGSGYFLECAIEAGAECTGIEAGVHLREWSQKRLGVSIMKDDIDEMPSNMLFDIITMFDVIEHVLDPVALMKSVCQHLTLSGIVVVFTPNFDSIGIKYMKEKSNLIFPTGHLTYFTNKSMNCLLGKVGLKLAYFETCGMDIADILGYLEADKEQNKDIISFLTNMENDLQAVTNKAEAANHMRIIASRVE